MEAESETYLAWCERTGEIPPFYDPNKPIEMQHRFSRAPIEAVRRLKEQRLMEDADFKSKMKAASIMTGILLLSPLLKG